MARHVAPASPRIQDLALQLSAAFISELVELLSAASLTAATYASTNFDNVVILSAYSARRGYWAFHLKLTFVLVCLTVLVISVGMAGAAHSLPAGQIRSWLTAATRSACWLQPSPSCRYTGDGASNEFSCRLSLRPHHIESVSGEGGAMGAAVLAYWRRHPPALGLAIRCLRRIGQPWDLLTAAAGA
jgi:hypothetical protein